MLPQSHFTGLMT